MGSRRAGKPINTWLKVVQSSKGLHVWQNHQQEMPFTAFKWTVMDFTEDKTPGIGQTFAWWARQKFGLFLKARVSMQDSGLQLAINF